MQDSDYDRLLHSLNLPPDLAAQALAGDDPLTDYGTFQVDTQQQTAGGSGTPKDVVVDAIKSFEQLAFIVCLYYKAKYGVPMPSVMPEQEEFGEFYLQGE